jgi:dTDP-4-dehydrorhamnose reductase
LKILLTGKNGQVGSALQRTLPELGEVIALDRSQLDLAQPDSIREAVRAAQPDVIVNAAAYTAVDQAESDESAAFAVNRDGPAVLAEEAAKRGALLVHFSTDYVFDGAKTTPYAETDAPNPLNVYGRSKLAGEELIKTSRCRHVILRTSWVYSGSGKNFLLTMLRLARERKELRVVDDQHGAPTSSHMLAEATAEAISRVLHNASLDGLYHMTAGGSTTWCAFARAIFQAEKLGVSVKAISSAEYPTPARRPANSLLDNSQLAQKVGIRLPPWEEGMRSVLAQVRQARSSLAGTHD